MVTKLKVFFVEIFYIYGKSTGYFLSCTEQRVDCAHTWIDTKTRMACVRHSIQRRQRVRCVYAWEWESEKETLCARSVPQYINHQHVHLERIIKLHMYSIWFSFRSCCAQQIVVLMPIQYKVYTNIYWWFDTGQRIIIFSWKCQLWWRRCGLLFACVRTMHPADTRTIILSTHIIYTCKFSLLNQIRYVALGVSLPVATFLCIYPFNDWLSK